MAQKVIVGSNPIPSTVFVKSLAKRSERTFFEAFLCQVSHIRSYQFEAVCAEGHTLAAVIVNAVLSYFLEPMKSALLRFVLLAALVGCSRTSDPMPGPILADDVISLEVTGTNLDGLTAELNVRASAGEDGQATAVVPSLGKNELYTTSSVSKTITVATVPHYRAGVKRYDFMAEIYFNTDATSSTANGHLSVKWLVNGKPSTATVLPPAAEINGAVVTSATAFLSTNAL